MPALDDEEEEELKSEGFGTLAWARSCFSAARDDRRLGIMESNPAPMTPRASIFWCIIYGGGIISMLVVYGVLQERIMTVPYGGRGGDVFSFSVFLVFCNRACAVVFAGCMALINNEPFGNQAPLWKCLVVSLSNVFASTCQYESLKYVSFAVQMLGKSFKMMPVMLWGICISGKRYSTTDWLIAAAVTMGVTEFIMTGPTAAPNNGSNSARGLAWLVAFLAFDGLTSTMQEKLFKEHKTTKYNQMLYVNLLSCCVSMTTLLSSNTFRPALTFCLVHKGLIRDASMLSASAVAGQYFIYSQVEAFGALVFAATMNIRQLASIMVSYMTYGHAITMSQVCGLIMVFFALFYKSCTGLYGLSNNSEKRSLMQTEYDEETPGYMAARRCINPRTAEMQKD
eukprot:CAMPEP_0171184366 /NCGR_PEP_ID=MMETSP0790-20130122/15753_1 /TAXON_ID=2925 /ORGANISM="Alexandrium catenella, Strain OF101" /LENGTH=396 /DNA_ID=CAMNT_0011649363 /DNA_START=76 /DNA_END=1266 /DNA_ORIENTATION=+